MPEPTSDGRSADLLAAAKRVAIVDLADELQVRKQWIFKIAKRLGIQSTQRRDTERGNQLVATVSEDEAHAIRREIDTSVRRGSDSASVDEAIDLVSEVGVFYLMQLEPEHDPGRIKVGFTTDLDGRIRKHRCSAPFATCTKSWPCRRTWERAAIDCITIGLKQLHTEVFRTPDVANVCNRADSFFSIMPRLTTSREEDVVA